MFTTRRPSTADIARFLDRSRALPLSYTPIGLVSLPPETHRLDEQVVVIGSGDSGLDRARAALTAWKHFDIGWVEAFPDRPGFETGTVVAVLIRHLGFWSLNGARVLYQAGGHDGSPAFGFAYGTLTNHAESGEELFEVSMDRATGDVRYRIRAVSRPRSPLARLGQPYVRVLQARFRRDSAASMRRAASGG